MQSIRARVFHSSDGRERSVERCAIVRE